MDIGQTLTQFCALPQFMMPSSPVMAEEFFLALQTNPANSSSTDTRHPAKTFDSAHSPAV